MDVMGGLIWALFFPTPGRFTLNRKVKSWALSFFGHGLSSNGGIAPCLPCYVSCSFLREMTCRDATSGTYRLRHFFSDSAEKDHPMLECLDSSAALDRKRYVTRAQAVLE